MKLTPQHHEAIQALILFRANEQNAAKKVADLVGVTAQRVRIWRKDPEFSEELQRQLRAYRGHFDDVPIAHRKERVLALSAIFDKLTDSQTSLKIKVLQAIRQEVGDDKQQIEVTHTGSVGVQLPPRAASYDEWLSQNRDMDRSRAVEGELVDQRPVPVPEVPRDLPPGALAAARGEDTRPDADMRVLTPESEIG